MLISRLYAVLFPASMKVPPKRKGNPASTSIARRIAKCLNESPSEKEGKFEVLRPVGSSDFPASMKVPPKRKGNLASIVGGRRNN